MSGMCDRNFWQDKLREQRFISHAIVDGRPYLAISRKVCPAINPATNSVLAAVTALQADDIDIAVKSSRASFASRRRSRSFSSMLVPSRLPPG